LRQAEAFFTARGGGHAEAFLGEKALDQIADGRVVVDDEHCFRAVGRCDRERRLWPSLRHGGGNVHGEGASAAGLALHRDVAAHHAGQAPAQRESSRLRFFSARGWITAAISRTVPATAKVSR